MLYPGMFVGIPEFASTELQFPAGRAPFGDKTLYLKRWWSARSAGDDFLISEMLEVHSSPVAAASFYRSDNPRFSALADVAHPALVGSESSYKANGSPNTSRVFCGILAGDYDAQGHLTQSCESWYWWARYGQYTVELYTMISLDDEIVYFDNFSKAVDVVSARIAACLATGC